MPTQLPDISIRQLEYLVAVADAPTWAVAANQVGVSASALSQGLAELERRVGVELFERHGRRRIFRDATRPVLDHARQVVALTGDLTSWAGRLRDATAGTVSIGMIDMAAVEHFPDVLRDFMVDRPDVALRLSVSPSAALLEELRAGRLDVVVCVAPPTGAPGVEAESIRSEPIHVFAPAGEKFGVPARWGPWVLFPDGSHTRQRVVDALVAVGAVVEVVAESHQPDVIRKMVALGMGWTALPDSDSNDDLECGPKLFDRELIIARRRGAVSDPAVGAIVDALRKSDGGACD